MAFYFHILTTMHGQNHPIFLFRCSIVRRIMSYSVLSANVQSRFVSRLINIPRNVVCSEGKVRLKKSKWPTTKRACFSHQQLASVHSTQRLGANPSFRITNVFMQQNATSDVNVLPVMESESSSPYSQNPNITGMSA